MSDVQPLPLTLFVGAPQSCRDDRDELTLQMRRFKARLDTFDRGFAEVQTTVGRIEQARLSLREDFKQLVEVAASRPPADTDVWHRAVEDLRCRVGELEQGLCERVSHAELNAFAADYVKAVEFERATTQLRVELSSKASHADLEALEERLVRRMEEMLDAAMQQTGKSKSASASSKGGASDTRDTGDRGHKGKG